MVKANPIDLESRLGLMKGELKARSDPYENRHDEVSSSLSLGPPSCRGWAFHVDVQSQSVPGRNAVRQNHSALGVEGRRSGCGVDEERLRESPTLRSDDFPRQGGFP